MRLHYGLRMGSFILPSVLSREGKFPAVPSLPGRYICAQNRVTSGSARSRGVSLLSWLGIRVVHRDLEHLLFQKGRLNPVLSLHSTQTPGWSLQLCQLLGDSVSLLLLRDRWCWWLAWSCFHMWDETQQQNASISLSASRCPLSLPSHQLYWHSIYLSLHTKCQSVCLEAQQSLGKGNKH